MTTFLLVRHALHEFGGGRIAGRTEGVHLSPDGLRQADALASRLSSLNLSAVYASPVLRCQETAAMVAGPHRLEVRTEEALTELGFGDWQGAELSALEDEDLWRRFNAFRGGTRAPNGELFLEVQLRMVRAILELGERHEGEAIALVSHADVIRAALIHFLGIPMDHFLRLEISPASVSVVRVGDYGPWVLGVNHVGDLPHLPE